MFDSHGRALLSKLDAQQAAWAHLFVTLDLLTDMIAPESFADVLLDVVSLHARTHTSKRQRAQWCRLAAALDAHLAVG